MRPLFSGLGLTKSKLVGLILWRRVLRRLQTAVARGVWGPWSASEGDVSVRNRLVVGGNREGRVLGKGGGLDCDGVVRRVWTDGGDESGCFARSGSGLSKI